MVQRDAKARALVRAGGLTRHLLPENPHITPMYTNWDEAPMDGPTPEPQGGVKAPACPHQGWVRTSWVGQEWRWCSWSYHRAMTFFTTCLFPPLATYSNRDKALIARSMARYYLIMDKSTHPALYKNRMEAPTQWSRPEAERGQKPQIGLHQGHFHKFRNVLKSRARSHSVTKAQTCFSRDNYTNPAL